MKLFKKLIPALLILIALPHGLSAMEKETKDTQKKGGVMIDREPSLMDALFSKKGLAVLGTGAVAGITWLTWSPTRTQQVQTAVETAQNHKGKIAVGVAAAGALYGLYKFVTRTPAEKPKVATRLWRDVREVSSITPTSPQLIPVANSLASDSSPTISTESEEEMIEEPLIMEEAPAVAPEIPMWLAIFINLCSEVYLEVEQERREELAAPVFQAGARNPFDLLLQADFIRLLVTRRQKATYMVVLGEYMEAYYQDRLTWFEQSGLNLPQMPENPEDLLKNELYSQHLNAEQRNYLTLTFQQMDAYMRELVKAHQTVGITREAFAAEMQAMQAELQAMPAAELQARGEAHE